jgi:hypothetical protein
MQSKPPFVGAFYLLAIHAFASTPAPHTQTPIRADVPATKYGAVVAIGHPPYTGSLGVVVGRRAVLVSGGTYCHWLTLGYVLLDRPKAKYAQNPAHLLPANSSCSPTYPVMLPEWVVVEFADDLKLPIAEVQVPTLRAGVRDSFEAVYFGHPSPAPRLRAYVTHSGTRYREGEGHQGAIKVEEWAYTPATLMTDMAVLDVGSLRPIFYGTMMIGGQTGATLGVPTTRRKPWFSGELTPEYVTQIKAILQSMIKADSANLARGTQ